SIGDWRVGRPCNIWDWSETFHVVVHVLELVGSRRIGDRCEMKDRVERFIAELLAPVEPRQILCNEIATATGEILKITRAEIVNYRNTRVRESLLQRQGEIRADETGAASDDEIGRRVQFLGT